MSFILDALKKADRKRKRGEVPELLTVHDAEITHSHVLLLSSGVFLWWLNPWQTAPQESRAPAVPDVGDERARSTSADGSEGSSVAAKSRQAVKEHAGEKAADDKPVHSSQRTVPHVREAKPKNNTIYNPEELPYSVQKDLQELIITVHLYSDDPSSRMINTYGKTVKEGQAVTDDLKLEEITPDSVIFSYKGYKFRKKLF
jgi:general secretion pathway protein B